MKLRKLTAFLTSLTMIVGLVFSLPVSAAIEPAAGAYYENVVLNVGFNTQTDMDKISVNRGNVEEGVLKFELTGVSSLIVNEELDKSMKQYSIEFDLATDKEYIHIEANDEEGIPEYSNPEEAAYIGLRLHGIGATPDGTIKGAWLGIMKNKIVLWYSYSSSQWKDADFYKVLDIPEAIADLSSASYKILYEGDLVEVYVKVGEAYEELISFTLTDIDSANKKMGVFSRGEVSVHDDSFEPITFADSVDNNYFAIYNVFAEQEDKDNPLAPTPEEEEEAPVEETPLYVTLDNLKVSYYNDKFASLSQIEEHLELVTLIDAAFTEMPAEPTVEIDSVAYRTYGIDVDAVREYKAIFEELAVAIENSEALEKDVEEVVSAWMLVKDNLVTDEKAVAFIDSFGSMEDVLAEIEPADYGVEKVEAVLAMKEEAKAIVSDENTSLYTMADLNRAYNEVFAAFKALRIATENGSVVYENSMTGALSTNDWYASNNAMATPEPQGFGFNWTGVLGLRYNNKYSEPYSVKVTTEMVGTVSATNFGIRQKQIDSWHEYMLKTGGDKDIIGSGGISIQNVYGHTNYDKVRFIMVKGGPNATDTIKASDIVSETFDITPFIGEGQKAATLMFKDYGDLVEGYVIGTVGEYAGKAVKFGSIVLYPNLTTVGSFGSSCSSGKIINHLEDNKVTEFSNVGVKPIGEGYVAFGSRGGAADGVADAYIRDFEVSTEINVSKNMPSEQKEALYYFDGNGTPSSIELSIANQENLDVATGETSQYLINATNNEEAWAKVAGHKDEYATGSVSVASSEDLEITITGGDSILEVDRDATSIKGKVRGTDIVTVKYGTILEKSYLVNSMSVMEKEFGYAIVKPEAGTRFEGTILTSKIANARTFKVINIGDKVIPAVSYAQGDGIEHYLGTDIDVLYESDNPSVISYDAENGVFVANGVGTAKIRATIPYTTLGGDDDEEPTPCVDVTVVAEDATYGKSLAAAYENILTAVVDDEATLSEKKAALDAAAENGLEIPYENDDEAELIFNAIKEAKELNDELDEEDRLTSEELVSKALTEASAVISVYETINAEDATASDLQTLLFGTDGIAGDLDFSSSYMTKFGNLKPSKASAAMKSLLRLATKEGTDLTADFLREKFKKVVNDQSIVQGGGGGGADVEITTDDDTNAGGFRPGAPAPVKESTGEKYKLDEASVNAFVAKYSDAKDAPWASAAIAALSKNGVIDGYEDGTIRPNDTITRDEFVKILVTAFGIELKTDGVNYYTDIPVGSWQIPYISAATDAGIVNGIDTLTFGTGMDISRQDMATLIYKAALKYNVTLPNDKIVAFLDAENIAGYAKEAVNRLAAAGVVSGMGDDSFAPAQVATRAQAFMMIYQIMLLVK